MVPRSHSTMAGSWLSPEASNSRWTWKIARCAATFTDRVVFPRKAAAKDHAGGLRQDFDMRAKRLLDQLEHRRLSRAWPTSQHDPSSLMNFAALTWRHWFLPSLRVRVYVTRKFRIIPMSSCSRMWQW